MRKPAKGHFSREKVLRDRAKPVSRVEARAHTLARALGVILRFEKPADVLMSAFFKANPQMGQKDRSTIAEAIFFAMRHYLEISWRMKPANPVDDPLAAAELTLAMQNEAEDGLSGLSPHRAQALQKALSKDFSQAPAFYRAEMPFWLFEKISAQNARPNDFFVSQTESAPLDLRVNTLKATREDVLDEIAKLNWEARPTPFSPTGIRLVGKPALTQTAIFKAGLFDVQDEGSQLIAQLLEAHRGEMVCDFCAGAGGKTLALGAAMKSKGRLYAFDVNQKRLESLLPRARRAGLSNVYAAPIRNEHDLRVKRLKNKFDRVLVDAPCSGTGTFRRNPDLKFRLNEAEFERILALQGSILESAATLVKPGGRLVYATCSVMREEDEETVERFLANHPEFTCLDAVAILGKQKVNLPEAVTRFAPYLRLSPDTSNTDGFFAAVLVRAS